MRTHRKVTDRLTFDRRTSVGVNNTSSHGVASDQVINCRTMQCSYWARCSCFSKYCTSYVLTVSQSRAGTHRATENEENTTRTDHLVRLTSFDSTLVTTWRGELSTSVSLSDEVVVPAPGRTDVRGICSAGTLISERQPRPRLGPNRRMRPCLAMPLPDNIFTWQRGLFDDCDVECFLRVWAIGRTTMERAAARRCSLAAATCC